MLRRHRALQLTSSLLILGLAATFAGAASIPAPRPERAPQAFQPTRSRGAFEVEPDTWAQMTCPERRQALRVLADESREGPGPVQVFVEGRRVASHDGRVAAFFPDLRRGEQHDLEMMRDTNDPVPVDIPPALISMPVPTYPAEARQRGIEGTLSLRALVGTEGRIEEIVVPRGAELPGLTDAAIAAAGEAVFRPAQRADRPVAVWTLVPFEFVMH